MKNVVDLLFRFNKVSMELVCKILYPLIFILVSMRLYFRGAFISVESNFIQHLIFDFCAVYYQILEPLMILILIKLLLEMVLLFYKK